MGFMNFLKKAESRAHAVLDKVPTAGLSVRAYNPDGTYAVEHLGRSKDVYTRDKAQEWADHLNEAQHRSDRPEVVWTIVDASEEHTVMQGEYVMHGEVKDSGRAFDGVIMDD